MSGGGPFYPIIIKWELYLTKARVLVLLKRPDVAKRQEGCRQKLVRCWYTVLLSRVKLWAILVVGLLGLTGCGAGTSAPSLGYYRTSLFWACYVTDQVGSYQVQVFNSAGKRVAVSNNVDVIPSTGKFTLGLCDVTAGFYDIPMTGGPFEVKYFADGEDVGRSWHFDIDDLIPIPNS